MQVGTPQFCAPEMLRNQPYSYPADMWALGCVMWEVLTGAPPFGGRTLVELGLVSPQDVVPARLLGVGGADGAEQSDSSGGWV